MPEYQPLTLTTVRGESQVTKKGNLTSADTGTHEIVIRKTRDANWRVWADGRAAGVVFTLGIGRWGIKSYDADSKPSEWQQKNQSRGYAQSGTLVDAVERVAHEFLGAVKYAADQAAKTPEQKAQEALDLAQARLDTARRWTAKCIAELAAAREAEALAEAAFHAVQKEA